MKFQKSAFPYLILLLGILIASSVADYQVEKNLTLEFEVNPKIIHPNHVDSIMHNDYFVALKITDQY